MAWESSGWRKTLWKGEGWFIVVEEEYAIDPFEPRKRAEKYGGSVAVEALKKVKQGIVAEVHVDNKMVEILMEKGVVVSVGGKKKEYSGKRIREVIEATWWPKAPVVWDRMGVGKDFVVFIGKSVRGTGLEKYWVVIE